MDVMAELARLQAENQALKAANQRTGKISFKVSEKGAVSVYGLGRFPVTLYREQWERLVGQVPALEAFIRDNASRLSMKAAA
jgi:hypothetical protein